ncbi:recombinase family protein [Dermacoccus barathri]|uniref:Recombinase family protein n=1 Tax=Dermacoccus abyssi TaxID=322596 RepID=A0ABX5ZDE5_9MICO|nr:recombinase family protein [Dermacoccus barathri]QEH94821.1 recombinase family protein [Dermacoccus abyssi]
MRIGYARRSTREQPTTLATQREADGCERIFTDTVSGAKSQRPGLDAAIDYLRSGDRLVVTRLDRLGRTPCGHAHNDGGAAQARCHR